jgi:hypothetical protein
METIILTIFCLYFVAVMGQKSSHRESCPAPAACNHETAEQMAKDHNQGSDGLNPYTRKDRTKNATTYPHHQTKPF